MVHKLCLAALAALMSLALVGSQAKAQTVSSARLKQESRQLNYDLSKLQRKKIDLQIRRDALLRQSQAFKTAFSQPQSEGDKASLKRRFAEWQDRGNEYIFDLKRFNMEAEDYNKRVKDYNLRLNLNQGSSPAIRDHSGGRLK